MNLTKNQIYIISAVVIAVIVWFVFFRKKTAKIAMAPVKPAATPAESNWNGAWAYTPEAAMRQATGTVDNSQAGTMSNYDGIPAFQAAKTPANFLGY